MAGGSGTKYLGSAFIIGAATRRIERDEQDRAMTTAPGATEQTTTRRGGNFAAMALGALGVVYGDICTSPLYTFKTALEWAGGEATAAVALGMLSLIVWTLVITTSIKYVAIVMRADNDGEGGILALMSLLGLRYGERTAVIAIGILGAALLYGHGAITPAISVLSALEGLKTPLPAPYVLPLSIVILIAVFGLQPQGTARIGRLFGPVMTLWFVAIGVLGLAGVASSRGAGGARSKVWARLSVRAWSDGISGAGRRLSVRDRRRGALCRHGALWPTAHQGRVVRAGAAKPAAELCRPDRRCCRWRSRGRRQSVLRAVQIVLSGHEQRHRGTACTPTPHAESRGMRVVIDRSIGPK